MKYFVILLFIFLKLSTPVCFKDIGCQEGTYAECDKCGFWEICPEDYKHGNCIQCTEAFTQRCFACDGYKCTKCQQQYVLNSNNQCINCKESFGSNCHSCDGLKCIQCEPPYQLNEINICIDCKVEFGIGCDMCNGVACTYCLSHYALNGRRCIDCHSFDSNCLDCDTDGCTKCAEQYKLESKSCQKMDTVEYCKTNYSNCQECNNEACTKCSDAYYIKDLKCVPCSIGCQKCQSEMLCDACQNGFTLISGLITEAKQIKCISGTNDQSIDISNKNFFLGTSTISLNADESYSKCNSTEAKFTKGYMCISQTEVDALNQLTANFSIIIVFTFSYIIY